MKQVSIRCDGCKKSSLLMREDSYVVEDVYWYRAETFDLRGGVPWGSQPESHYCYDCWKKMLSALDGRSPVEEK